MRALTLTGPRQFELITLPDPAPGPGQVRVKVAAAGICGSDLGIAEMGPIFGADYAHPILGDRGGHGFGHEFSGHVDAVGEGVDNVEPGTLVAVRANVWDGTCAACRRGDHALCANGGFIGVHGGGGAFSDYVVVGPDQLFPLPAPFTPETGALVEPLAVGWRAVRRSGVDATSSALVVGAGPVGISVVLALQGQGVHDIVVSEPSATRRELAHRLGVRVVDPTDPQSGATIAASAPDGVDATFDCAGIGAASFDPALAALRPGGTFVMVAMGHENLSVPPLSLMLTEVNLTGSNAYDDTDFAAVVAAVVDGRIDPSPLISSVIALDEVITAGFDHLFAGGRTTEMKMLVTP